MTNPQHQSPTIINPTTPTPPSQPQKIRPIRHIHLRLRPIPQHHPPKITHIRLPHTPYHLSNSLRTQIPLPRALLARRRPHINLRPFPHNTAVPTQIPRPGLQRVDETRLSDVAARSGIIVELHEDEIHALHRGQGDGFVGPGALGRGGYVVGF